MAVLNAQIHEILATDFDLELGRYNRPCYFAMSPRNPLVRFETTLQIVQTHFEQVRLVQLHYPIHRYRAGWALLLLQKCDIRNLAKLGKGRI